MSQLLVIARHTMRAGAEPEVLGLLEQLVTATRQEPGNVSYVAYRQLDEPRTYVLLERYASPAAFAEHRASEHFRSLLLEGIAPLLEDRTVEQFDVPD